MNNYEIIQAVEEICSPHFKLELNDIYGDRGSCVLPKIDELKILHFKLDGYNRRVICKNKQQDMVDKIKELNIGTVVIVTQSFVGRYIIITPHTPHIKRE
jgi:hypothetical protein